MSTWLRAYASFYLGGLRSEQQEHVTWATGELAAGDEITIRVLGPGEFDAPAAEAQ